MRSAIICFLICAAMIAGAQVTPTSKALALEQQGQWKQAEAAWREVIQGSPADGAAQAHLGLVLSREEEYAQAAAAYRRALALKANLPGVELNLGLALFKQEKLDEAIGPLKAAVAQSPDNMQAQLLLGMCYYGTAQYALALPYLKTAVAKTPGNLQLHTLLAQSCLWSKNYGCTLEQYRHILGLAPESAQADMLAGEALDGMNDTDGAIRQFEAAAKASPREPNVHFGLGYLLWKQRSYTDAESQFKLELANDPNHAQALAYLADIKIKQDDNAAAEPLLMKATRQHGAPRIAFLDLGILYASEGRHDEAIAAFQHAILMDPSEVDAHWRLARLYASMGRQQEAKAEFAKTNELHKQRDEPLAEKMAAPPAN